MTEGRVLGAIQHPNVVAVYEFGEASGIPYLAMEFCPGGSLDARLRNAPLPAHEAAALVEQLARGVAAAHAVGVLHRDLKPANVLFAADGTPKLTDFGLARRDDGEPGATIMGMVLGTPSFMAPEQARGETKEIGVAVDVYGLGAILYCCLTGRPPFRSESTTDTLMKVLHEEPVPPRRLVPSVPRDLEAVCLNCLRKEPTQRYPQAAELAAALRQCLGNEAAPNRARRRSGWRWWPFGG